MWIGVNLAPFPSIFFARIGAAYPIDHPVHCPTDERKASLMRDK
jgi:hypothetical protein